MMISFIGTDGKKLPKTHVNIRSLVTEVFQDESVRIKCSGKILAPTWKPLPNFSRVSLRPYSGPHS